MGRIGETDSYKEIYWSGSSIKLKFEGTSIEAILDDEHGENFFNVIVDENNISIIQLDSTKEIYELASNLSDTIHTVEIFKRTEWTEGKTKFYGFQLNKNAKIIDLKEKVRSMEFYGNSITAGYAVEDYSGKDSPEGTNTNNYNSYANMTARHFDANYNCIVRSGIGITVSWFPMIMDELYYRLDPSDKNSLWDFSNYEPDIVVINLFQNDSWIVNMPDHEEFKNRFSTKAPTKEIIINSYRNFVRTIKSKYSN
ncbi:MAG: electron transporter RnfD, partial [Ignavibacteriae bacterium]|nr:electron transporter RnfD [Ignavibacteriota bacterium]